MKYTVLIPVRIQKSLSAMPRDAVSKVDDEIMKLQDNPRPHGCEKLRGREGWRIRVGTYRVIYEIDDSQRTVAIRAVAHRKDVYR